MTSKIPTTARNAVKRRSLGRCERCGARGTDVHHRKGGNPRKHNISNLVRLCRTCHEWATRAPVKAARTGWVLTGSMAAENASAAYLALLGRYWVRLDPAGGYGAGQVRFENVAQVQHAAEVMPLARPSGARLTQAMLAAVSPSDPLDTGDGDTETVGGLIPPASDVTFPRRFCVQGVESVDDFTARLAQELKPVHWVGEKVGPLNEPR